MPTSRCPECDADVHVDIDSDKGDKITCDECGAALEVVGLDPVELDRAEDEDDDLGLDDDDEEDDY